MLVRDLESARVERQPKEGENGPCDALQLEADISLVSHPLLLLFLPTIIVTFVIERILTVMLVSRPLLLVFCYHIQCDAPKLKDVSPYSYLLIYVV
jgi:hypothetical protein